MQSIFKLTLFGLLLLVSLLGFSGCMSSSSSGSNSGSSTDDSDYTDPTVASGSDSLTLASKVSVVEAKDDTDLDASLAPGNDAVSLNGYRVVDEVLRAIDINDFAASSDYNQDRIDVWVHEESVQAFNTVNEILCSIDQSGYAEMKNQGNYRAQIDSNLCSSSNDDASEQIQNSQNQTSGSNATNYEEWIVNSSREENQPHIVKVWITEKASDEYDEDKMIMAKMQIYQSASDTNPFGYFKLNFIAYPLDADGEADTSQDPLFKGYMRTVIDGNSGDTLLQFVNSGSFGPNEFTEQATFRRSSSGSAGSGTLSSPVWESEQPEMAVFNIAYNADYFLRQKGSETAKCYDRSEFDKTVWDYAMYDNAGSRVQIDSGFPIKYGDYYGWVGYYGLWLPEEASISHGDTVYKQDYNSGSTTETAYTVFIAGGRLIKHSKKSMSLGDLKSVPLQWWDNGVNYRVEWNGTKLQKTATLDETNWTWQEITAVDLDLSSYYSFYFWSEALGGSGSFNLVGSDGNYLAPSDSTVVNFHVQNMVYPTDTVPGTLLCYENCPDAASLSNTAAETLKKTDKEWYEDSTGPSSFTYHSYTFGTSDMLLRDNGTAAVMSQANENNPWGFSSGILFEGTTVNYNALECSWTGGAGKTCNYQGWENLSVYYTWETGPENWNKFTGIKNNGAFAEFDPPMKVTYTHSQSDSSAYDYKYNGAKFQLEYNGYGNLHGIPGRCIDPDTGTATDCSNNARWIPEFSILPGALVRDVSDGATEYVVKPLHVEQRMLNVALSNCGALSLASYSLPSLSLWVDPDTGARPEVTDAPAVIGGEVQ